MHLIQPIDVLGSVLCVKTWRTDSVLSGDLGLTFLEAGDSWNMEGGFGESLDGQVAFGTSCLSSFTLEVNYDKDNSETGHVEVSRNGAVIWEMDITLNRDTEDIDPGTGLPYNPPFVQVFSFTSDRPCGDVWEISGVMPESTSGSQYIRFDIYDVTY